MVLIISNKEDSSTNKVIDWLEYYNAEWIRNNQEDRVEISFLGDDFELIGKDFKIRLSQIKSTWYRRGCINNIFFENNLSIKSPTIEGFIKHELNHLKEYFYYLLTQKKHISSYLKSEVNKLIVLEEAKKVGLQVPATYIYQNQAQLDKHRGELITKSICGNPSLTHNKRNGVVYTQKLVKGKKNSSTKSFLPSLFQESISKKYELRIFYLAGKFYSMAIFSQKDAQTGTDYRKYNNKNPNRNTTYKLPDHIESKIDALMKAININCGSIDIIVTPDNRYVFLEVNPVGQFGMVSFPCNYRIEKQIAKYLIDHE